jgi:zinc transport system permease protein
MCLLPLTVVVLIRVVGIMLIIALLTALSFHSQAIYQTAFLIPFCCPYSWGIIFCSAGLWVSYLLDIPSGAAIIIIAVSSYFLISMFKKPAP